MDIFSKPGLPPHTHTHAPSPTSDNGKLSLSSPLQAWGFKIALVLLALSTGPAVALVVSSIFDQTSANCSFIKLSLATQYLSAIHFLSRFRSTHPNTIVFILGRVVNLEACSLSQTAPLHDRPQKASF